MRSVVVAVTLFGQFIGFPSDKEDPERIHLDDAAQLVLVPGPQGAPIVNFAPVCVVSRERTVPVSFERRNVMTLLTEEHLVPDVVKNFLEATSQIVLATPKPIPGGRLNH